MKQIHVCLALALLLFAGLNCGTETPVEETVDPTVVETPTGTLRGEVQSIEGVVIQVRLLKDGELLTQTEIEATYELGSLEAGDYTLQISAKGYETTEINVTAIAGQTVSVDKVTLVALADSRLTPTRNANRCGKRRADLRRTSSTHR